MTLESKNFNFPVISWDQKNNFLIEQQSIEIHKHQVQDGYLILSKNDFGKIKTRVNVGYFNKKTNFMVGEKNSLIVLDQKDMRLKVLDTSEILKNQRDYFLIYDLSFIKIYNERVRIKNKITSEEYNLELNDIFGYDLGKFLKKYNTSDKLPEDLSALNSIIFIENNRLSLNKHILSNSNPRFLLSILEGYLSTDTTFIIKENINIYNFTYILNLLGAQYSIRSIENNQKHLRFKLPLILKTLTTLDRKYFRYAKYFAYKDRIVFEKKVKELAPNINDDLFSMINSGWLELIPIKDLKFLPVKNEIMYDLTMPNINAQNYFMKMTPLLKNSDGDILGIIGMHTKDAAEECSKKFGIELKQKFLSLNDAKVQNWGIKLDAALGLYNATK